MDTYASPVTHRYVNFIRDTARSYLLERQDQKVPYTSFDSISGNIG